ncbi:MAG: U32 family peptidase, partial [Clostridiales bacterium]|nr:U32 family peptidase [Clostridiales bacterium]
CLTENRKLIPILAERDFVTHIILDISPYGDANWIELLKEDLIFCHNVGKKVAIALPRVLRERSYGRVLAVLPILSDLNLDGILVRNYGELEFLREQGINIPIVLDHNMYAYNDMAVQAFKAVGAGRLTVPIELNRAEILRRDNCGSDMLIYGHYPLMTSAQCIRKNTGECDGVPSTMFLKDRKGATLPVKNFCHDCVNVIYNALPTMLFSKFNELRRAGIDGFRLDFTVENEDEAREILDLFCDSAISGRAYPTKWENRYTGGHYGRGVE